MAQVEAQEQIEPDFNTAVTISRELEQLIRHPGWKHIASFLATLSDGNRLVLNETTINNVGSDPGKLSLMLSFVGGEVSAARKLLNMINARIKYGKTLASQLQAQPPVTPDNGQG